MFWAASPFNDNHTAIADTSMVQALCLHYVIHMYLLLQSPSGGYYNYPPLQVRKLSLKETEVFPPRSLAMLVPDLNSSQLNSKDCALDPTGTLPVLRYP